MCRLYFKASSDNKKKTIYSCARQCGKMLELFNDAQVFRTIKLYLLKKNCLEISTGQ